MDKKLLRAQLLIEAADALAKYDESLNEAVTYHFLPKFKSLEKQHPELEGLSSTVKEAETLLTSGGIDSNTGAYKLLDIVCRILSIYANISAVLSIGMAPFTLGASLIGNAINQLFTYLFEYSGEFAKKEKLLKVKLGLIKMKEKVKGKDAEKIDNSIKKIDKMLDFLNK